MLLYHDTAAGEGAFRGKWLTNTTTTTISVFCPPVSMSICQSTCLSASIHLSSLSPSLPGEWDVSNSFNKCWDENKLWREAADMCSSIEPGANFEELVKNS